MVDNSNAGLVLAFSTAGAPLRAGFAPSFARGRVTAALFSDQSSPGWIELDSVAEGAVTVAVTASETRRIALLVQKGAFPKSRVC